jgi:hypothetical protein
MARRHAKKFKQKVSVTRILLRPAVHGNERTVTEVAEGTPDAVAIKQDDGSTKFFLVTHNILTPAVYKVMATGPTMRRGEVNEPQGKKVGK